MIRRDITSGFAIGVAARRGTLTGAAGIRVAIEIGVADITPRADSVRHILIRTAIKSDYIGIGFVQAWSRRSLPLSDESLGPSASVPWPLCVTGVLIHLRRAYWQASDPPWRVLMRHQQVTCAAPVWEFQVPF